MLETQKIPYALGIDVGSTTVKTVLLTEMGEVLSSSYERHFSKVRETVCTKLASLAQEYPDVQLRVSITGSAGLGLAQAAGLPFVRIKRKKKVSNRVRIWLPSTSASAMIITL